MEYFGLIYKFLSGLQPVAVLATAVAASLAFRVLLTMRKNELTHLDESFKKMDVKIDEQHKVVKENFAEVHKNVAEVHRRMDDHLRDHATGAFGNPDDRKIA